MKHVCLKSFDVPDGWYKVLNEIWYNGEIFNVGYGSEPTETKKLSIDLEITNPSNRPLVHEKAPTDMGYVNWYALKYLWGEKKEDDETYTYANRMRQPVDQIEEGINRFVEETNDRQVVFCLGRPDDIYKKDKKDRKHEPPCLRLIDASIENEQLNLSCYFRSWDAYAGLPSNIAGLQIFNEALVSKINQRSSEKNKRDILNITPGKLVFHSKNAHIYKRQYELVEGTLNRSKSKSFLQKVKEMKEAQLSSISQ